jgi:hypothetical protein
LLTKQPYLDHSLLASASATPPKTNFILRQTPTSLPQRPLHAMDFNNLKNTVSNISLYDLKAGVRQLQNGAADVP